MHIKQWLGSLSVSPCPQNTAQRLCPHKTQIVWLCDPTVQHSGLRVTSIKKPVSRPTSNCQSDSINYTVVSFLSKTCTRTRHGNALPPTMTFWVVFFSSGFSEILGETEWNSHAAWLHSSNGVFWGYTVLICITLDRFIPEEKHFKHKRTGSRQIWLSWTSKTSDTPLPWETYIKYMICMCNYTKSSCIYIYINIIYRHMIFSVIWHYFGFMSCQHRQRCVCAQISRWHVECSKSLCMLCTNSFGTQPLDDTSKVSSHNVSSNVPICHLPSFSSQVSSRGLVQSSMNDTFLRDNRPWPSTSRQ